MRKDLELTCLQCGVSVWLVNSFCDDCHALCHHPIKWDCPEAMIRRAMRQMVGERVPDGQFKAVPLPDGYGWVSRRDEQAILGWIVNRANLNKENACFLKIYHGNTPQYRNYRYIGEYTISKLRLYPDSGQWKLGAFYKGKDSYRLNTERKYPRWSLQGRFPGNIDMTSTSMPNKYYG